MSQNQEHVPRRLDRRGRPACHGPCPPGDGGGGKGLHGHRGDERPPASMDARATVFGEWDSRIGVTLRASEPSSTSSHCPNLGNSVNASYVSHAELSDPVAWVPGTPLSGGSSRLDWHSSRRGARSRCSGVVPRQDCDAARLLRRPSPQGPSGWKEPHLHHVAIVSASPYNSHRSGRNRTSLASGCVFPRSHDRTSAEVHTLSGESWAPRP